MEKVYDPERIEARWAGVWAAAAPPARPNAPPFSMVIPPPNVTGALHVGHALNNTLQDILARWRRMRGDDVVWIPGTDHAGIATQNVVERQMAQGGESRHDLSRDAFIQRVWDWKAQSGGTIIGQLKRLGASCNWERERFTMDEGLSRAVREVFVRLHGEGLIYRAKRLINWCTRCQTALSDIEVEHEEGEGKLYHIAYPLVGESGVSLTVATTRPETLLGDTAVAVHPDDPRFNRWIGRTVQLPLTHRTIPVVGDAILVDREFGTGAVKITPGHDFNDEQAGRRHGLATLSLLTPSGLMDAAGLAEAQVLPEYAKTLAGKRVSDARTQVVTWLSEAGALVTTAAHRHAVGKCYRCRTAVEPLASLQWFVRMNDPARSLAAPAIEAVRSRRVRLIPESWEANFFGWMENIQDWCISRQIWWGHSIPAWYCRGRDIGQCGMNCGEPIVSITPPTHCPHCGSADLEPDGDVLDTWFSSALWPFSTLGWPSPPSAPLNRRGVGGGIQTGTSDLARFYPTSVLVTSFDILFFWVARMTMMGLHFMKEVPFRTVYIHALVRDAEGQKMSKSRGNVVDPLAVMGQYGTDALRFTLASLSSPGRDIRLAPERIEGYRNFANKIWNAARFIQMNTPAGDAASSDGYAKQTALRRSAVRSTAETQRRGEEVLSPADRWIVARLRRTAGEVNQKLEAFRFDEAATAVYQFVWHAFCDWYLELVKVELQDAARAEAARETMSAVFADILKLLHPFMPFITEELGQTFYGSSASLRASALPRSCGGQSASRTRQEAPLLSTLSYPTPADFPDDDDGESFEQWVIEPVMAIRNLRGEMNIPPSEALPAFLVLRDEEERGISRGDAEAQREAAEVQKAEKTLEEILPYLIRLARLDRVMLQTAPPPPYMTVQTTRLNIFIPRSEAHRRAEIERLEKDLAKLDREREPLMQKLADPNFARAPQAVQEKQRLRVAALTERRDQMQSDIARLGGTSDTPRDNS
jgi:valyl-tRNA synthetase